MRHPVITSRLFIVSLLIVAFLSVPAITRMQGGPVLLPKGSISIVSGHCFLALFLIIDRVRSLDRV
jgi:hypothetical protein